MKKMRLAIIDYQMSNMFSVKNALDHLGYQSEITSNPATILNAGGAVLPGVGAFPEAMRHLHDLGLDDVVLEFASTGKPLMGICLGLQLMFTRSEEFEECQGLNLIDGRVVSLANRVVCNPIPHVGWNTVHGQNPVSPGNQTKSLKVNMVSGAYYYFVHSYFVEPDEKDHVLTTTRYGGYEFCSSVVADNIFACQFHPEKSGPAGLKVLEHFFR